MSELQRRKKEFKEIFDKDFRNLSAQLGGEIPHPKEVYIEMLIILKAYFDDMRDLSETEPWVDMDALIGVISGQKDYQTYLVNFQIGCFVDALVKCGSPARQAYLATAELLNHKNNSPQTSSKAYDLFKKSELYDVSIDAERFVELHAYRIKKFLMPIQKDFPSHIRVRKAKVAYDRLLGLMEISLADEGLVRFI